ncbi:MAG TPA: pyrroline-5-carboxylate reductase, partial [Polyangiaceae bacterium]|nr:pyrroline-5-carboxylate reductase [Polyangiaceae bacterium]
MLDRTVGFVGAGNMAGALIKGLLHAKLLPPERILASDPHGDRLGDLVKQYGIRAARDNVAVVREADVVVLAVKPQVIDKVLAAFASEVRPGSLLISVAAGVPVAAIEHHLPPETRVVRTMPNTAAMVLAGATAISPGTYATEADLALARTLFEAVGRVTVLDESLLDAVTGLSGSGPAYIMLIIEALAD